MTRPQAVTLTRQTSAGEVQDFVARVGANVRRVRQSLSMSRRELSERSGVSQRYLAQLETGSGNISVALLFQVATALGQPAAAFLTESETPVSEKAKRICLIGLRGAGKSTLGALLGQALDRPFLELNGLIEDLSGIPVGEVINLYGQEGYRDLERQALDRVIEKMPSVVLAVGGGVVSGSDTYRRLLSSFHTVWLKASPEEHMERVRRQGDDRPMAGNPKAMDQLRSILTDREYLYARADAVVDTSGCRVEESLANLKTTTSKFLT
ncbi:MAG: helix-turn-helix transcriptional regulator [Rhizobiaceae bacterium]